MSYTPTDSAFDEFVPRLTEEERAEAASQRICREEKEAEAIADSVLMGFTFTADGDGIVSFADLDPADIDTALNYLARIVIHGKRELPEAHRFIYRLRAELTELALRRMRT
jgi:hypothetical protein